MLWCQHRLLLGVTCMFMTTSVVSPSLAASCRDKTLWPFASDSIWNTPIGSKAAFVPANIYAKKSISISKLNDICANETAHPSTRHLCPGAHGGITPSQCHDLGCCFSPSPEPDPHGYPWCFTPTRTYGPSGFHNDAEYWVITSEDDPLVEWVDQGWWGTAPSPLTNCSQANCNCHCDRLPDAPVQDHIRVPYAWTTDQEHPNNGAASFLLPDNVTVLQMQPTYRCTPGSAVLSKRGGCPQPYPEYVSILDGGPLYAFAYTSSVTRDNAIHAARVFSNHCSQLHVLAVNHWRRMLVFVRIRPRNNWACLLDHVTDSGTACSADNV
eukprot:m.478018 g.478018  ORF g.478018 m.478018 type:complete len:325 (-) comp21690_c0_seq4:529-1503(-)